MKNSNFYEQIGDNQYKIIFDIIDPNTNTLFAKSGTILGFESIFKLSKFLEQNIKTRTEIKPIRTTLKENSYEYNFSKLQLKLKEFYKDSINLNPQEENLEKKLFEIVDQIDILTSLINPYIGITYVDSNFNSISRYLYRAGIAKILANNFNLNQEEVKKTIGISLCQDLSLLQQEENFDISKALTKEQRNLILNKKRIV